MAPVGIPLPRLLRECVESFRQEPGVDDYRDSEQSAMQCNEATERFVRHMRECGVESADDSSRPQQQKWMREWIRKITQPNGMGLSEAPGPDFWGYRDRTREGHIHHVVALAEFDGDTYFVDWTASQYYPGTEVEFPVIRKLAGIDPSTKEPKWLPV